MYFELKRKRRDLNNTNKPCQPALYINDNTKKTFKVRPL